MKRFMKRTTRYLAAIFLTCLLLSCAGSHQAKPPHSPLPADCWLSQPTIYRLRQSARLEYQGKQEILEGFMELDLNRDRAHLIIFNALGLTLLNIEVERHRYQLAEAVNKAKDEFTPNRRKQQFAEAVATAVQHIFFSLERSWENHHYNDQPPRVVFFGSPPRLTKICEKLEKPTWSVTYHNYHKGPAGWLPERIILQSHKPAYRLTIWLHKAELLTKISR